MVLLTLAVMRAFLMKILWPRLGVFYSTLHGVFSLMVCFAPTYGRSFFIGIDI